MKSKKLHFSVTALVSIIFSISLVLVIFAFWSQNINHQASISSIKSQCTSGVCCNTTQKKFRNTSYLCKSKSTTQYGCPWGTQPGSNVGVRYANQYCSGTSSACTGNSVWSAWNIYKRCASNQSCQNGKCIKVVSKCSDNTLYNQCSKTKPLFCQNGSLINKCSTCGCTINQKCVNNQCINKTNDTKCENLSINETGDDKVNILFLPDNVSQNELNSFKNRLMFHVDAFYQTEPFKSNKKLLNFYFLKTTESFFKDGIIDFTSDLKDRLIKLSLACNYKISQFIIVEKESIVTPATLGEGIATTYIGDPNGQWTTLHEFGHSFAGLADTYYPTINHQGTGTVGYDAPNVDEGGCKKWCTSDTGVYSTACTQISDENECKQHERTLNEWGWVCSSPEKCCVWLDQPDLFFDSQCVNPRDHKNIGINCLKNTGCYYGTNYQGKWRPNDDFDSNSYLGIMGGDTKQPWRYDPVSVRTINLKIQCCYPQQSTNYPVECENYSARYYAFHDCGSPINK